jgi:predicted N-acetyltransferase YhbS
LTRTISLIPDNGLYNPQCEALYARAFGPGRHAKAAARLREGNVCQRDVSILAFAEGVLVGACRLWPIETGNGTHVLFLGPIAVDAAERSAGLGHRLVSACLKAVDARQSRPVILVGDLSFFDRMGFEIVPPGQVAMPGPVDPKRLLWRLGNDIQILPEGRLSVPHATSPKG